MEMNILLISNRTKRKDKTVQITKVMINVNTVERWTKIAKINKKITLKPSSAGTTAAALDAKLFPLLIAIKTKATTIVEGSVPRIPPTFEPYRSAINIMIITTNADRIKGRMVW